MSKKCFVHLGKHGDLMILMPGWKRMFERTGERPIVMVSNEFAPTMEGITYAMHWKTPLHWYGDCGQAHKMAVAEFGRDNVTFPKWWDNPEFTPPEIRGDAQSLIIHGKRMKIETGEWFSYMASQWKYAGFPLDEMFEPVVFDRRNRDNEAAVKEQLLGLRIPRLTDLGKKRVLYCLNTGGSSPFPMVPEVQRVFKDHDHKWQAFDLMQFRAPRIFDLLGAIEASDLVVTSDTAILHLMGATTVPYYAFLANGGGGSIPRGNCIGSCRYEQAALGVAAVEKLL